MSAIEQLQQMFPDASADALTAILDLSGGDVNAATDYLLSNEGALEEVENGILGGVPAPPVRVTAPRLRRVAESHGPSV